MRNSNKYNVAVIILNYFGFDDTYECIKSVKNSLPSTIFLVDNSANDFERNKLEGKFKNQVDIKLIFPQENLGFAAGVNLGLREAVKYGFHYFILINNDAVLVPESGEVFAKAFLKHPSSLISPVILWGENIRKGNYYQKYFGLISSQPYLRGFGSIFYFTGCALGFDKTVLEKIGHLDETFFFYGEDIEFCNRSHKHNIPLINLDYKLVEHKGSKSARLASFFYEYHMIRSHFLLAYKIFDNPFKIITSFSCKFLTLFLRSIFRGIRYKSFIPLIALFAGALPLKVRPSVK